MDAVGVEREANEAAEPVKRRFKGETAGLH